MGFRINTNIGAMNAHVQAKQTNLHIDNSLQKLSSGLRINKAADDASGMAIADSLNSQALGLGQSIMNANDGIGVVQTADGALAEYINIINTVRTKAIQAASDGQSTLTRKMIQSDVNKLLEEAQNIAASTSFNGLTLLNGSYKNKSFHIGPYAGETVKVNIENTQIRDVGIFAFVSGSKPIKALPMGSEKELKLSVKQTVVKNGKSEEITVSASSKFMTIAGTTGASSLQRATALADEFNEQAHKFGVGVRASVTEISNGNAYTIRLDSKENFEVVTGGDDIGGVEAKVYEKSLSNGGHNNSLASIDVITRESAEKAVIITDYALQEIGDVRSKLGSAQQKLESTIRNISVTQVNVKQAESQIRDVDFAKESANFNKQNILAQSGTYAMSQANAVQQNVLKLLQ